ncbi:hypothetical protein GEM21_05465 [Salmonella enterica]|nr:hypothetical protein [Salmonella enterica]EEO2148460.1 hypothetical protein [Salmonella enterica]EIL8912096.1 hypothetical protein [Salmonella enterica]
MLMDNEKLKSDAEFKATCSMIKRDFEKVIEYIKEHYYQKEILSNLTTAGKRESLVHKYHNLDEVVSIVSNAVQLTAPKIEI